MPRRSGNCKSAGILNIGARIVIQNIDGDGAGYTDGRFFRLGILGRFRYLISYFLNLRIFC